MCKCTNEFSEAQIYAVLSQCLALDTNTTKYLFLLADPCSAVKSMHEQITNHMRVCVAIEDGIETLCGIASSEPILSEAASRIMSRDSFSLHGALKTVLTRYCINQGDCGEIIVTSFFTWACDQVVKSMLDHSVKQLCPYFSVTKLFQHLFTDSVYRMWLRH